MSLVFIHIFVCSHNLLYASICRQTTLILKLHLHKDEIAIMNTLRIGHLLLRTTIN